MECCSLGVPKPRTSAQESFTWGRYLVERRLGFAQGGFILLWPSYGKSISVLFIILVVRPRSSIDDISFIEPAPSELPSVGMF
jgi:hypothetical protein